MSTTVLPPEHNELLMHVSNAVVGIVRDYLGRGPTRARAHLSENVLVVVTEDNFTKAERKLVAGGDAETVRGLRRTFQEAMRADLVAAVESLTGRRVNSFLSDHDPSSDQAVEVFILDGSPAPGFA